MNAEVELECNNAYPKRDTVVDEHVVARRLLCAASVSLGVSLSLSSGSVGLERHAHAPDAQRAVVRAAEQPHAGSVGGSARDAEQRAAGAGVGGEREAAHHVGVRVGHHVDALEAHQVPQSARTGPGTRWALAQAPTGE